MHLESTLVTPSTYEMCALPHDVTSVVADPHEIANVAGRGGIDFFLNSINELTMDFNMMLPSCVPATSFEKGGAILEAKTEMMNAPGVFNCDKDIIDKLMNA